MTTDKSRGEILLYKTEDGNARLEVRLEQETIWLDAHQMGTLFERDRSVIVKHIQSIYCHIAKPEVPLFNNLSKYEIK